MWIFASHPESFLPSAEMQNLPLIKVTHIETNCTTGPKDAIAFPLERFCDVNSFGTMGTVCLSLLLFRIIHKCVPFKLMPREHLSEKTYSWAAVDYSVCIYLNACWNRVIVIYYYYVKLWVSYRWVMHPSLRHE